MVPDQDVPTPENEDSLPLMPVPNARPPPAAPPCEVMRVEAGAATPELPAPLEEGLEREGEAAPLGRVRGGNSANTGAKRTWPPLLG
jgi:hypothetical protein